MLPLTPPGQVIRPRLPGTRGAGGSPSEARARRAHSRTVVNSARRPAEARTIAADSAGKSRSSSDSGRSDSVIRRFS
ncbi:hypothetical protein AB0F25_24615 [Streptomyces wedmorensis]